MNIDFKRMAEDWPSPFVARSEIGNFTRGLYKPVSMNSYDARGLGIKRRIIRGLKVAYLKKDVIEWLKQKVKKLPAYVNIGTTFRFFLFSLVLKRATKSGV